MSLAKARIACTALGGRIKLGYPAATGKHFNGDPVDVTSDCLKAVIEFVKPGHEVTVNVDGAPRYTIHVRDLASPSPVRQGDEAVSPVDVKEGAR